MRLKRLQIRTIKSKPYLEGVGAMRRDGETAECPYPSQGGDSAHRIAWWNGYLDERNKRLLEL